MCGVLCDPAIGLFEAFLIHLYSCLGEVIFHLRYHIQEVSHHGGSSSVCVTVWQCCPTCPSAEDDYMGPTHEYLIDFLLNRDY